MPKTFFSSSLKVQTTEYPKIKRGDILIVDIAGKKDKYRIVRKYSKKYIGSTYQTNIFLEPVGI